MDGGVTVSSMVRWKQRGGHSQRYSWGLGSEKAGHRVRNEVPDVQCNSTTRMGFMSIKPEETIAREGLLKE